MKKNPLLTLESFGQSIWTDFISRRMIEGGELKRLIEEDGISGVTSNPSIFEKAIAESHDYDEAIRELAEQGKNSEQIYEILTVEDIQHTADLLRPTYDRVKGADGYVSIEVSPKLAYETNATIQEARRLWREVNRPNVMIKVPGTQPGLAAIRRLTSEGVNVNITLLFGLPRYGEVVDAYIGGLEDRLEKGQPLKDIASVASFFLSRIDVLVDPMLDGEIGTPLQGTVAIASAKVAYKMYSGLFSAERFAKLSRLGAKRQRLLWASTSTKNPKYSDVKYVEPLIGKETVNTLPIETISAYRDHGMPQAALTNDMAKYQNSLDQLKQLNISIDEVTQRLEKEGVEKFIKAYDVLMKTIKEKASQVVTKGAA